MAGSVGDFAANVNIGNQRGKMNLGVRGQKAGRVCQEGPREAGESWRDLNA